MADVAAWFHGGRGNRPLLPTRLRLAMEYLRSAIRADLPVTTRLACAGVVLPALAERRLRVAAGRWRRRVMRPKR